jgi:hypothetical protein
MAASGKKMGGASRRPSMALAWVMKDAVEFAIENRVLLG